MERRHDTARWTGAPAALLALVLAAALPSPARAQALGTPNGVKVGPGRLHPSLRLETRVDSAAGFFPGAETGALDQLRSEVLLHVRPGLKLEVPGRALALEVSGYADVVSYTGLVSPRSTGASHVEGGLEARALLWSDRPLGFELTNKLDRTDRTTNAAVGAGVLSLTNAARAIAVVRPGGGAIELRPSLGWSLELFQPLSVAPAAGCADPTCSPIFVSQLDASDLVVGTEARWRFLPKTALTAEVDFTARTYLEGAAGGPPARLLRSGAGLAGLVSPRVAVVAKAGYAVDLGASGGGGLTGQLDATYALTSDSSLKGGYVRALMPVSAFGTMRDDRFFAEGKTRLRSRLELIGRASVDWLQFYTNAQRTDRLWGLQAEASYPLRGWLTAGGGYALSSRATDATAAQSVNFARHEAYLRVTFSY